MNDIVSQYKDNRSDSEIKEHREKRKLAIKEVAEVDVNAIINRTKKPLTSKIEVLERQLKKEQYLVTTYKNMITNLKQQLTNSNK